MKRLLVLPVLSALLAVSCSNDNSFPTEQEEPVKEGVKKYLNVSIVSPGGLTKTPEDPEGTYENGSANENNINLIRFYFFDEDGEAVPVFKLTSTENSKNPEYLSYIDWYPINSDIPTPDSSSDNTVEKIVNVTLGINQPAQNDGSPALVLAVINPPSQLLSLTTELPLKELEQQVSDYCTGLTNNNFVMTNSVYAVQGSGNALVDVISATPITEGLYKPTEQEASETSPLNIYVERVVARVDLSIGIEGITATNNSNMTIYPLASTNTIDGEDVQLYLNLKGWNVTETPNNSRLVKAINPDWGTGTNYDWISEDIFNNGYPWNLPGFHRSFWSINPPANQFTYMYGDFEGKNTSAANQMIANALNIPTDPLNYVSTYVQENAAPANNVGNPVTNPTKVILPAQLVNESGTPQALGRWANRTYLMDNMLTAICNSLNLYYESSSTPTETVLSPINPDYLQILSATDLYGEDLPEDVGQYYSYVQLNKTGESIQWYNGNTQGSPELSTEQVNTYILDRIGHILAWDNGYTYYYVDIQHLGGKGYPGYYGIVRNHVYKVNITSIDGLGTPVFNPDEIIYPTKTQNDDQVLTATVNILQWRIVSEEYDIVWP